MSNLLDLAMAAHGGLPRWREVGGLKFRLSSGGLLFSWKWQRRTLHGLEGFIDCSRPRTVLSNYPVPGHRGVFHPAVVRIETEAGRVVQEGRAPRLAFASPRRALYWDHLDLLYFAGYAIWNYLCAPFLLASRGFATEEVSPWREGDEEWRRLRVCFPPDMPTHSPERADNVARAGPTLVWIDVVEVVPDASTGFRPADD